MSDEQYETTTNLLDDIERRFDKRFQAFKKTLNQQTSDLRAETKREIAELRSETRRELMLSEAQHDLIMEAIEQPFLELTKELRATKIFHHRRLLRLEKNVTKQAPF